MKKIFGNNILRFSLLSIAIALALISCSDWVDEQSITIEDPNYGPNYDKYLVELREYRKTDHKIVYAWFENVENSISQAHNLTAIPDSVDIINMLNPDNLSPWVQSEMRSVKADKGMKIVYTVSYSELETSYNDAVSRGEIINNGEEDPFLEYATNFLNKKLALFTKYEYDGISALFNGKKTLHMTDAEKVQYLAREALFMGRIAEWVAANANKMFIFEGKPQNLTDKTILNKSEFIVIRTEGVQFESSFDYEVLLCIEDGVPTDRFVIASQPKSLDLSDTKTGFICDRNNKWVPFIPVAGEWVATMESRFTKKGLGIYKIQNDYYYKSQSYINTRIAIKTMNPSPKL